MAPIFAAVWKIASLRSPPRAETMFSSPRSNAALRSGPDRATSGPRAAIVQPSPGLSRCHALRYRSSNVPLVFFLLCSTRLNETLWP